MSRLEKKCLLTSTGLHLLLVVVLLVGPGLVTSRNASDAPPLLDVIPSKLVDEALSGGGNPNVKPLPPSPNVRRENPAPTPPAPVRPRPRPEPVVASPEPEPPARPTRTRHHPTRTIERAELSPSQEGTVPVSKPKREKPKRDLNLDNVVTRSADDSAARERAWRQAREREAREATARAEQRREEIANLLTGLRKNLSPGVHVDVPGPGGEAYANYAQVVYTIYNDAWILPGEVTDESLSVRALVTIARDGNVIVDRTTITRRSGNSVMDRSVQRALDRVRFVAPFPGGAKESEREFIIYFNVKAKRSL
ncbi:MAG: cell envelope integrity protein TolA, partial [Verrucomicrobia bacterium]|nr:cell envelope integrity protein TolA [Verrucomicrobiota bacterium]